MRAPLQVLHDAPHFRPNCHYMPTACPALGSLDRLQKTEGLHTDRQRPEHRRPNRCTGNTRV